MRINPITVQPNKRLMSQNHQNSGQQSSNVVLKGTTGKLVGGLAGFTTAALLTLVAGPLAIAAPILAGIATTKGAEAGDKLEEENKSKSKRDRT